MSDNKFTVSAKVDLNNCPLFFEIEKSEIDAILERSVLEVKKLDKGEHVVRQNDKINSLYLLVDGLVRTEMLTKDGNLIEIEFIEPIRPLAPAFLVASNNRYPVDVITMQKSIFYIIPKSLWLKEMMMNEQLMTNFMKLISNMTVFLSQKVQMMSVKTLKGKLSLYILENTTPVNNTFTLKRTQVQLAEYFGVQRPSLARTLGDMIREGLISVSRKELTVLDRNKLERLV